LEALVAAAAKANQRAGITGLLLAEGDYFLQVLEGPRECVSELFARIARDPRHARVTLIEARSITETSCPKWGMTLFDAITKSAALWPGNETQRFDPTSMSERAIVISCVSQLLNCCPSAAPPR
jgi:hypothetical protein